MNWNICSSAIILGGSLLLNGCGPAFKIPGVPVDVALSDICGQSTSCGMSGIPLWAKGNVSLITEDPKARVGGWDDHNKESWFFNTMEPCTSTPIAADAITDTIPSTSKLNVSATESQAYKAKIKAELAKYLKDALKASVDAKLDVALNKALDTELSLEPHLISVKEDNYRALKKDSACQNPAQAKYVRHQIVTLMISGTSSTSIKEKVKAELAADAEISQLMNSPVDGSASITAAVNSGVDKTVDTVVNRNFYLLGVSWEE